MSSSDLLRQEARIIREKAEFFRCSKPAFYIEEMKKFWALNTKAANLEEQENKDIKK